MEWPYVGVPFVEHTRERTVSGDTIEVDVVDLGTAVLLAVDLRTRRAAFVPLTSCEVPAEAVDKILNNLSVTCFVCTPQRPAFGEAFRQRLEYYSVGYYAKPYDGHPPAVRYVAERLRHRMLQSALCEYNDNEADEPGRFWKRGSLEQRRTRARLCSVDETARPAGM